MRGLTSRGVRPCLQHSSSGGGSLARSRRAITPPTQLALTTADAFIILLPGVLTAAFVFDVTARQRRSDALQQQIDRVEQESEALKERQLKAWERIQHRSVRRGAALQRRMMSTVATQEWLAVDSPEGLDPEKLEADFDNENAEAQSQDVSQDREDPYNVDVQIRYERLVATRLALSLMLELRTGRTGATPPRYKVDPNSPSMDYIMFQLEKVIGMIGQLRIQEIPFGVRLPQNVLEQKELLHTAIMEQIDLYKAQEIHLPQLIMNYTHLVKEYKVGPPVRTHVRLMRAISIFSRHSAYARFVEEAIWHSHEPLDDYTLTNIFFRLGKAQESHRLVELQERLTKTESWPRPARHWFRTEANGLNVIVPATAHPYTLPALIRATLLNQQQSLAEAQAVVFMQRLRTCPQRQDPLCKYYIVAIFLESYAVWGNWNTGKRWLETAASWAKEFYSVSEYVLARVVLRMLDFCVSCQQREAYRTILDAALAANLQVPAINPNIPVTMTEQMEHIRRDWINQTKQRGITSNASCNIDMFQNDLVGLFDDRQELLPMSKPFHPAEGNMSHDPAVRRYQIDSWRKENFKALKAQTRMTDRNITGLVDGSPADQEPFQMPEPIVPWPKENFESPASTAPQHSTVPEAKSTSDQISPKPSDEFSHDSLGLTSPFFQEAELLNTPTEELIRPTDHSESSTLTASEDDEINRLRTALEQANRKVNLLERQLNTTHFQSHNDDNSYDMTRFAPVQSG